jgi:Secretion system C-terminal sorting domain
MREVPNYKTIFTGVILIISAFSILLYAHSTGITGVTKKSNSPGCTCHGPDPSSNVVVTINGPDTLTSNQTANYFITITGGPLTAGGTDIAVSNGSLNPLSNDLRIENGELTHNLPKTPVSKIVTFNFTYTAPSTPGEQTIFANGNSVNFNGQSTGDQWNYAPNKTIEVLAISGVENESTLLTYKLDQNYPNPFNPSTKIRYIIPREEFVSLKVFDLLGNEIATLVNEEKNAGSYEVTFTATNISSGIYLYTLKTGEFYSAKKLILLK